MVYWISTQQCSNIINSQIRHNKLYKNMLTKWWVYCNNNKERRYE